MDQSWLPVILVLVTGTIGQQPPTGQFFDCHRKGQSCVNGTCDSDGTKCICYESFTPVQPYHCLNNTEENLACTENKTCNPTGKCHGNKCYCNQMYFGDDCQHPRIQVTCTSQGMQVAVTPHREFQGIMYAKDRINDLACWLGSQGNGTWNKTFSYNSTFCGIAEEKLTGAQNGTKYTLYIIVQYIAVPSIILATDQQLQFTCFFLSNTTITGEAFETNATGSLNEGTGQGIGEVPLNFSITKNDTDSRVGANEVVKVGDKLTISIRLLKNTVYTDFLVVKCTASNGQKVGTDYYASLDIVQDGGCPADNPVVRSGHTKNNATDVVVEIPLFAFMFSKGSTNNKNTLSFSCDVRLCGLTDEDRCSQPNCSQVTGYGRRRRRAAGDEDVRRVGQAVGVQFGSGGNTDAPENEENPPGSVPAEITAEDCLRNPELQAIIAILCVLVVLILIAFCVLLVCFFLSNRRDAKSADDSHSMGSSTQALHSHSPRRA